MKMNFKKVIMLAISVLLVVSTFGTTVLAADPITVSVRIISYNTGNNGIILNEYQVTLDDSTGYTALDALEKACDDNSISYTLSGNYVDSIGGLQDAHFTPNTSYYSGWMYRVWTSSDQPGNPTGDTLASVSAADYTLTNGDKITWYYAIPASTWYTTIGNYASLGDTYNENSSISVTVKGQKFSDVINWELTGFDNLQGALVVLARASDGRKLGFGITDANGVANIWVPSVCRDTNCYIYVQNKFFTSGELNTGLQYVKSWRKPVTIKNVR